MRCALACASALPQLSNSTSSPESASQRLSFCKPAMPGSPWYSPQRLLGGNRRTEDDPISSRTRRQLNRIPNMTPRSRQRVTPVAPGSLRLGNGSSTHPARSAERSIEARDRIPMGFEADSPTPRNLEEGRHCARFQELARRLASQLKGRASDS